MEDYVKAIVELCNSLGEACVYRIGKGYVADTPLEQIEDAINEIKKMGEQDIEEDHGEPEEISNVLYLKQPD